MTNLKKNIDVSSNVLIQKPLALLAHANFLKELSRFVFDHILNIFSLSLKNIFFFTLKGMARSFFIIRMFILLAKFCIHKCKFNQRTQYFPQCLTYINV